MTAVSTTRSAKSAASPTVDVLICSTVVAERVPESVSADSMPACCVYREKPRA
eukprot:CAMPEP_0119393422 /NCGR_PEP_ID=MMETSP1334-20130426/125299_1 /TAXON_ID=127549 /ORGANISM="Calcidiscus leptoporus, Strain RCC1130" /LENGTH=52 /DNA_ID=CAMNT_0007416471 /DNA_START=131 /DNA_END=285 /DNA_ORIENTATION=-